MARRGYGYGGGYRGGYDGDYGGWPPYVPVAERRRRAMQKMKSLQKKGLDLQPVTINGRKIASSFWGDAWCEHLESFSDFENRLPRGRTYVRNGSVCHLAVAKGQIKAMVSGSSLYNIEVSITTLPDPKWVAIKGRCSGQIGSLLELLQGQLSDHVMQVVTDRAEGLFPLPGEMAFRCSCPDWARMCKHVAAVLYGIGSRLDTQPELLFTLRGVNHEELIGADAEKALASATSRGKSKRLATSEIGDVFGIEIDADSVAVLPSKTAQNGQSGRTTAKLTIKTGAKLQRKKKAEPKVAIKKAADKTAKKAAATRKAERATASTNKATGKKTGKAAGTKKPGKTRKGADAQPLSE